MNPEATGKPKPSLLTGALGAQVLSLFLPCLLMWWTNAGALRVFSSQRWSVGNLIALVITAVILCSTGTLVLGLILVAIVRRRPETTGEQLKRQVVRKGAIYGAVLAFFNVPAYLGFLHVGNPGFIPILGVGGAMAGAWIGWRVYGKLEPPQPFWPRFSLGTLVLIVVVWAALFFLYAPKEW